MRRVRELHRAWKILALVALLLVITILGLVAYFVFSMTIGETYGLQRKLDGLDNVVSVEDYDTYEGLAFFTLVLTDNRHIGLSAVGNQDLVKTDGMTIDRIGGYDISCKYSSGRAFSSGIHTTYLGQEHIVGEAIESIPKLIEYYDELEKLFSEMPLEFSSPDLDAGTPGDALMCRDGEARTDAALQLLPHL